MKDERSILLKCHPVDEDVGDVAVRYLIIQLII